MPVDDVVAGAVSGGQVRRARFVGRLRLPAASEVCLWRGEVEALGRVVAGDSDAYGDAPGFVRLAAAYLHLLEWHERHRAMVAMVLAGEDVH